MPRPSKPPRLWLRERKGRDPLYVILDRGHEISTGCGPERLAEAEAAFGRYLGEKYVPKFGDGDPARVPVADIITLYVNEVATGHAHPELVGYHTGPLLDYFGDKMCWDVNASTCHAYVLARGAGIQARRKVKATTARRELETLGAALHYAYKKARALSKPVYVSLPDKAMRRERWLTRSEAARLLAGALGWKFQGDAARPKFKRVGPPSYNVARFVLSALYTCTRHEAVLAMRWGVNSEGGWYDLGRGVMYRRGEGERDTRKRRTPAPIPAGLEPHLRRWRGKTIVGPCEYAGEITKRQKTGWARARDYAGLGADVTPHTLKHTGITWLLQAGVSIWEVAGFTGTSEKMIREVYGHHAPDHLPAARLGFHGRNMGKRA